MRHQEIVLRNDGLVRVVLGLRVLDVVPILVLWQRQGTSTALEWELELGLRLFYLGRHVAHFRGHLRGEVGRR